MAEKSRVVEDPHAYGLGLLTSVAVLVLRLVTLHHEAYRSEFDEAHKVNATCSTCGGSWPCETMKALTDFNETRPRRV